MSYRDTVEGMSQEMYKRFLNALELGRWPDGAKMTEVQRNQAMQAVILWGEIHLPEEDRVGFVDLGRKKSSSAEQILKLSDK